MGFGCWLVLRLVPERNGSPRVVRWHELAPAHEDQLLHCQEYGGPVVKPLVVSSRGESVHCMGTGECYKVVLFNFCRRGGFLAHPAVEYPRINDLGSDLNI